MRTVAEVAKVYGVSSMTIYRKLGKGVKQEGKQGLTVKQGNITYITQEGEDFLSSCLTRVKQSTTNVEQPLNSVKQPKKTENEEILFLRRQLEKTQDELTKEREHSREITGQLAEITRNNQILLKGEQERANPKQGLFGLFRRKG